MLIRRRTRRRECGNAIVSDNIQSCSVVIFLVFVFWASIIPCVLRSDCVFGVATIPCIFSK